MKALDRRNETARQRELKRDVPQPFYKAVIESVKACPHCGEELRRRTDGHPGAYGMDLECRCSFWAYEMYPTSFWRRTEKAPAPKEIGPMPSQTHGGMGIMA